MASILEEEAQIRNTILRSCFYADMGQIQRHVETIYTEDIVVEVASLGGSAEDMIVNGRDGVSEFMNDAAKDGVPWRHFTTSLVTDVEGDRAAAKTYLLLVSSAAPWTILDAAYYEDSLVKQDGRWMVDRRRILGQADQLEVF